MPRITTLYAGLLLAWFLVLTWRVLRRRFRDKVNLGAGGDRLLERAIRAHGNFAEYVPLFLLALMGAELSGAPPVAIHLLGASVLLGRVLHAEGIRREPEILALRAAGMLLTIFPCMGAAVLAIGLGLGLW